MEMRLMRTEIQLSYRALEGKLHEYQPMEIVQVDQTDYEAIWDDLIRKYHFLGYDKMIGQRIKYLVLYESMPIAALSFNRATLRIAARDEYVGWDEKEKLRNLHRVVNNNRFLIAPWVRIKNLASHLLSRTLKQLQKDWYKMYGTRLLLAETFVDERYKGTCYLAANWKCLGKTKGYGKIGSSFVYHGNRKAVYIYPLQKTELALIQAESCRRTLKFENRNVPNMMLHKPDWNPTILEDSGITEEMIKKLGKELEDYLFPYQKCINYAGQEAYAESYVKGLMSDLEYKSAEPIALRYGMPVRGMQRFLKDGKWDTDMMLDIYQEKLSGIVSHPEGMITLDGCGNPKKGNNSVGVARQYCGATGKVDNCQTGVFIGYSGPNGYGLIDRALYIPEKWFDEEYKQRRDDCGIPEGTKFRTSIEIASSLLDRVSATGLFPARWVGVDSFFGRSREFLASIPDNLWYFADIPADTLIFTEMPAMIVPPYGGRGRRDLKPYPSIAPVTVSQLMNEASISWNRVTLGEGAKGPIVANEFCRRVVLCNDHAPTDSVWLYIRQLNDGSFKFSICNAPEDTPIYVIREAAIMRWPIEQCFEECKSCLGLDQYEARSWNAWYRHTLLVFIAHLFLTIIRIKYKKKGVLQSLLTSVAKRLQHLV